jgi:hypothetical protein
MTGMTLFLSALRGALRGSVRLRVAPVGPGAARLLPSLAALAFLVWAAPVLQAAAPTTTGISSFTVAEDAAPYLINLDNCFDDDGGDANLTYRVTSNSNLTLVTTGIAGNPDNLTLTFSANGNGTADITVRATDGELLWVDASFTVTVTAANDTPSFTKGANQAAEPIDGAQTVTGWATNIEDGDPEVV